MRKQLSTVTVYLEDGESAYWITFREFLLTNAHVLKKMVIYFRRRENDQSKFEDLQRELFLLQPASPDATLELKPAV